MSLGETTFGNDALALMYLIGAATDTTMLSSGRLFISFRLR